MRVTERAGGPVPKLLDMLRKPFEPLPANTMCPAIAYSKPYFMLVDAEGKALLPDVPTSACGKPHDHIGRVSNGFSLTGPWSSHRRAAWRRWSWTGVSGSNARTTRWDS